MSELAQAIEEMRNMRESYDQLSSAAEAYNEGKPALAEAITAKGVEAAATDSLATMAEKVMTISQDTYEIDGGEMYAKQLFGVANNDIVPGYWNLYDIMAQLLSDGRLVNYGGILLAEYYKGYDSLALSGAGAGGAYVVSDKDENGQFKIYTADTTHIWATEDDGKGNRWVAYCFADEYHDFQITDTNKSPRSIFIGRKVGTITSLVDGRCSQIVVPDGNKLHSIISPYAQNFSKSVVLRNIEQVASTAKPLSTNTAVEQLYIDTDEVAIQGSVPVINGFSNLNTIIIKCNAINRTGSGVDGVLVTQSQNVATMVINAKEYSNTPVLFGFLGFVQSLFLIGFGDSSVSLKGRGQADNTLKYVYFESNSTSKALINFYGGAYSACVDAAVQTGFCRSLNISKLNALTEANMYAHILQRLKQDEPDCGDGVTITLGATNLAKLTSQESIDLLDLLTNTYGYTFA